MRNKVKSCIADFRSKYGKNPRTMWMNGSLYESLNADGIFVRGLDGNMYFRFNDYATVRIAIDFNPDNAQILLTDSPV